MAHFIKKNWYYIGVILILLFATFLRFYRYEQRWGFAYDQAHDVIIAKYAIENFKIPLLGPFSSAGPFQTGGQWYWFIMTGILAFPFFINGPWIFLTLLYVVFVLLIMVLAKEMLGKTFSLITGLLAAVSTAQITQGTNLTNQSPQAIISLVALYSMYRYVKTKKPFWLLLLGLCVTTAAVVHLQGVMLFSLIIMTILFTGLPKKKDILYLVLGVIIPLIPLIIYDINHDFFNSKNIIIYQFFNDNKISYEQLGRRWLTYVTVFWPNSWAHIIGGSKYTGYFLFFTLPFLILFFTWKRKISREWYIIFLTLGASVLSIRYVRTPIFDSYLVFLHPFVLLTTAWFVYIIFKFRSYLGLSVLCVLLISSLLKSIENINNATNLMAEEANHWKNLIVDTYPDKKFVMYDFRFQSRGYSLPLVYYLYYDNKISDNGYKLSFGLSAKDKKYHTLIKGNKKRFELWDINASSSANLKKAKYSFTNPSEVYRSTQEWHE